METRYTVQQTVEMTGIKSYVLRYWEEELELQIHRNELGHRYYTRYDIQLFMNIKELKKRGLRLHAIRELIPKLAGTGQEYTESRIKSLEEDNVNFDIPYESDEVMIEDSAEEKDSTNDEKILEFQTILERLIAQELKVQNESEDEEGVVHWILQFEDSRWQEKKLRQQLKRNQKRNCSIATVSFRFVLNEIIQLGE